MYAYQCGKPYSSNKKYVRVKYVTQRIILYLIGMRNKYDFSTCIGVIFSKILDLKQLFTIFCSAK